MGQPALELRLAKLNIRIVIKDRRTMADSVRSGGLDKFYTISSIAKICVKMVDNIYPISEFDLVVEPSAGNGSFLHEIQSENKIGLDISPEHDDIIKMDFFEYTPYIDKHHILTIGNPPFGKVSSLAIRFFNHAAKWSDVIAFIIPKTFRKTSVQNRLSMEFHLVKDMNIPNKPCSFVPPMSVKCCFQVWERRGVNRVAVVLPDVHADWKFLKYGPKDEHGQPTPPTGADFAIRAYGGQCGFIQRDELHKLRPKSWHFIKSNIDVNELIDIFNKLDYSDSLNTARQNSIGKKELVQLYTRWMNIEP